MPFGDGTGPSGQGPRTGRGAGFCSGFGVPGSMNRGGGSFGGGRGGGNFGGGRGGGRGWRNRFFATGLTGWQAASGSPFGLPSQNDEVGALKAQAGFFERALDGIRKRIEGLEAKAKPE